MSTIRVLLAEDHTIVREGLRLLLESQPDITVVGEAGSGREAVSLAQQHHPDVVIMDLHMPDLNGLEATRLIRDLLPDVQVLVLTMYESDEYFFQAIEAGAAGYVLKKAATDDLVRAVRAVAQGDAFLYPSMARRLLEDYRQRKQPLPTSGLAALSEREREVFMLLAQGLTNQQIAEKLVISPSTVQTHRAHIMEKLGLKTTADLIRYAIRHGLIEP